MDTLEIEKFINDFNKKLKRTAAQTGEGLTPQRIPTGSLSLDLALNGGWPTGRQVSLWGNRSSTKSTLSLWTIANAQAMGKTCAYIDSEKTFESQWAEVNGVKVSDLSVLRINTIEDYLEASQEFLRNELFDVVVIDSVDALDKAAYYEEGDKTLGHHSRATKDLLKKNNAWNNNTLIILINQTTTKIESNRAYNEYSGGQAMHFYPSVSVRLMSSIAKDSFIEGTRVTGDSVIKTRIGQRIHWDIYKTKISTPRLDGYYYFMFDGGNDKVKELIDVGTAYGFLPKSGNWFEIEGQKFNGPEQLSEWLKENPDYVSELTERILS
jgi:recombination protein RecA